MQITFGTTNTLKPFLPGISCPNKAVATTKAGYNGNRLVQTEMAQLKADFPSLLCD